jgi:hypothetical protein
MTEEIPHADLWSDVVAPFCFGGWAGTVRILGTPPQAILEAILAFATGTFSVDRGGERHPWPASPIPHQSDQLDADSIFTSSLVVWGGAEGVSPEDLDLGLRYLCHEGNVLMAHREQKGENRLRNILEAACYPPIRALALPSEGVSVRTGLRDAPHQESLTLPFGELTSHTVVVLARGHSAGLEDLLCDLLMRASSPPTQVMVMDLSGEGELPAPLNLYGFPEHSPTEVFLARPGPIEAIEVVFDALSGAEGRLFSVLSCEDRCAPNWLRFAEHFTEARSGPFAFEGSPMAALVRNRGGQPGGLNPIRGRAFSTDWLRRGGLDRLLSGRIRKLDVVSTTVPLLHLAGPGNSDAALPDNV